MEKTLTATGAERTKKIAFGIFCLLVGFALPVPFIYRVLALIGGISLLLPGKLKLDNDGFSYGTLVGQKHMKWADIGAFVIVTQRTMGLVPVNRKVGWKFVDSYKRSVVSKVAGKLVAFDGVLPDNYGMKPDELAAILEAWRLHVVPPTPAPAPTGWVDHN